jgi:hypothetical protein
MPKISPYCQQWEMGKIAVRQAKQSGSYAVKDKADAALKGLATKLMSDSRILADMKESCPGAIQEMQDCVQAEGPSLQIPDPLHSDTSLEAWVKGLDAENLSKVEAAVKTEIAKRGQQGATEG